MPKITFDTDDYYDDDTLSEMIEDETRDVIRYHVKDMLGMLSKNNGLDIFVRHVASQVVSDTLNDVFPDYKNKVIEKVCSAIEELSTFDILYHSDKAKQIIDEAVDEIRPMIKEKAKQLALEKVEQQVDAEQIVDYVCDEFYNIVSKQLSGNNE